MRYIDSGVREPSETLGTWLTDARSGDIVAIRWQTGFFGADSLSILAPLLERATKDSNVVRALIGSNECSTSQDDVRRLFQMLGMPRANATLGVVSFQGGAFYHPKVVHLTRRDGSQLAYVGSANLTGAGVSGQHVEAGILLDTSDGDDLAQLHRISRSIDRWFDGPRPGLLRVETSNDIDYLTVQGILAPYPFPRSQNPTPRIREAGVDLPNLSPIVTLPPIASPDRGPLGETSRLKGEEIAGYPPYLRFAKDRSGPTRDAGAITGRPLPAEAAGLIIQLNQDNARHFLGRPGTANISIPVATANTIRFGLFGKHHRPRAEFPLMLRYVGTGSRVLHATARTSVMGYGFTPNESGHRDIRMVVPASVKALNARIAQNGHQTPSVGDVALLEWPTSTQAAFRLTFLDQTSPIAIDATSRLHSEAAHSPLADGTCWLPKGLSPAWETHP